MPNFYNPYQYPQNVYQPQIPMQANQLQPYQPQSQQLQNMQQQQPQQQIQNGGFVPVTNEMEARNYPVSPGKSITFKDETAPYVYTKTMGFSQLDRPIFEKYRLVKEEPTEQPSNSQNSLLSSDPSITTIEQLKAEIKALQDEIEDIREQMAVSNKRSSKKKEAIENDPE